MIRRRRTFALILAMAATSCLIGWAGHHSATPDTLVAGQMVASHGVYLEAAPTQAAPVRPAPVKPANTFMAAHQLCTLNDERINESSGVAASRLYPGYLWTHNDSGDSARLFLITTQGKTVAEVSLQNAKAEDWEDMAIAGSGKEAWVYAGDTGDNGRARSNITIYRFREPTIDVQTLNQSLATSSEAMILTYPDGPHDAETLIATTDERLLIVTKDVSGRSTLFITPQPFATGTNQVLKKVDTFAFGAGSGLFSWRERLATGGDLSPDGRHLVVCTYTHAYEWTLPEGKTIEAIWQAQPRIAAMPTTSQGEAICYSSDGRVLYSTSEKSPAPLFELTPPR